MNRERPLYMPEQFPRFANQSWGRDMQALQRFAGYTARTQIEKIAERLTGRPIRLGDTFSSYFLPDDISNFLSPEYQLDETLFNTWTFQDENGDQTERIGFRTIRDDTIRLAYCEYRDQQPESVGFLMSWINPQTEESVLRDASVMANGAIVDRRTTVFKDGEIEFPVVWYGDPNMHIGKLPRFHQIEAVYDRHPQNSMELAYARQAVFDADDATYEAHEYMFELEERTSEYYSHAGEKTMADFQKEVDDTFPPDESLEGISVSVWNK